MYFSFQGGRMDLILARQTDNEKNSLEKWTTVTHKGGGAVLM